MSDQLDPSDVGIWVSCIPPPGKKEVFRKITRYDPAAQRFYAITKPDGVERILPKGVVVRARYGADFSVPTHSPRNAAAATPSVSPHVLLADSLPTRNATLANSIRNRLPSPGSTRATPGSASSSRRLYTPPSGNPLRISPNSPSESLPADIRSHLVRPDTPISFLAHTFARYVDGGTDLAREFVSDAHGMAVTFKQDREGHTPRSFWIKSLTMPEDAWERGIMTTFWNQFVLPFSKIAKFDILCVVTSESEHLQDWARGEWERRVEEARVRPPHEPTPYWAPIARFTPEGTYVVVRRGLPAGHVIIWMHEAHIPMRSAVPSSSPHAPSSHAEPESDDEE